MNTIFKKGNQYFYNSDISEIRSVKEFMFALEKLRKK